MAAGHGKNQVLKISVVVGGVAVTDVSSYVGGSALGLNREQPVLETTTLGKDAKTFIKDLRNGNFSAEFEFDNTLVDYLEVIYSDDTVETLNAEYYPTGETTGNKYATDCMMTNYSITGPIGLMSIATDWQCSGEIVKTDIT